MKRFNLIAVFLAILILVISQLSLAQEAGEEETEKNALKLEEVRVTAPRQEEGIVVAPSMTTINIEEYKMPGTPKNIVDVIKDRAIIDFRGQSDLVPTADTIFMRGFGEHRFTTAMDGLVIDTGGVSTYQVVDYATLSLGQIESIEIMPGPHSALYSGKSMGGVINLKTKTPERYTILKPDFRASTSYRSYNTQNHSINVDGGADSFVYGASYQYYHTNGYLRNNRAEIDNYFTRFGYILPSDGYISLDVTYTDQEKEDVVPNAPGNVDYNNNYPETTTTSRTSGWPWQEPESHMKEYTYRLNYKQPTPIGLWTLGAYYRNQDWKRLYFREKDTGKAPEVKPDEIERYSSTTTNRQAGGRIQNEIELFKDHTLTLGFDMTQMWQPSRLYYNFRYSQHKTADIKGWYLQDRYTIIPRLTLTAGLRYEDVSYWRSNRLYNNASQYCITGYGPWIRKNRNQWVPKSFLTYELDDLSHVLRDTSLSLGVSSIWNPLPFCYGCFGQPWQVWVKPEHGIGYDLILTRRLWKDINLKIDYSFYKIRDYVTYHNYQYSKYCGSYRQSEDPIPPGLELSDCMINLKEMRRQGVELELNGHILDSLSFYANYTYTALRNMGGELAGRIEAGARARHRVNAGLRYNLFKNTLLMLDYKFQDKQIAHNLEEVAEGEYIWYTVPMDKYHVFDFAIEQTLFKKYGFFKDVVAKFYINNLFDEEYENSRGYPMTDRTYGSALSFRF